MSEIKYGRPWVGMERTNAKEGAKKGEIIDKVFQLTGVNKGVIKDVLNAFTDVAQTEMVMEGVFNWPGLPTVTRVHLQGAKRYQSDVDKTILYPDTAYLRAKVPQPVKSMLRGVYREQLKLENGLTDENWWEPYVYCDGDWREKE